MIRTTHLIIEGGGLAFRVLVYVIKQIIAARGGLGFRVLVYAVRET